jgi:prepilin-type N-terminal cleavage/methylation domain-containing protein
MRLGARSLRTSTGDRLPDRGGFTLAEVAVTILIVGIGLMFVLQGLNIAKIAAAQTRNVKLARDLALLTLGRISSGLEQDEIENGLNGTYADEGYPEFTYDVVVGDESFRENNPNAPHDSWQKTPDQEAADKKKADDEQDVEQPFEKVKIRVTFPKFAEYQNEQILEQWIPWAQVYGDADTNSKSTKAAKSGSSSAGSTSGSSSGSGSTGGSGTTGGTKK